MAEPSGTVYSNHQCHIYYPRATFIAANQAQIPLPCLSLLLFDHSMCLFALVSTSWHAALAPFEDLPVNPIVSEKLQTYVDIFGNSRLTLIKDAITQCSSHIFKIELPLGWDSKHL